jgi:2-methylaconitate cis-trans-isomerase PrpF
MQATRSLVRKSINVPSHPSLASHRGFAQLLSTTDTMITRPESPPPTLIRASRKRKVLPASWMRAGTSKGLFIQRKHLPSSQEAWSPWILAAMGSKCADPRQLDGMGGATSTTSKVAIVAPSQKPGIDVEYTFAQVAVGKHKIDYSGNCGNIASGVGPFALEEGLVQARPGDSYVCFGFVCSYSPFTDNKQVTVRILNTNTGRVLEETVAVDEDGYLLEQGDYRLAGVADPGVEIKVAFVEPAGSMTGTLLPTGNSEDTVTINNPTALSEPFSVQATLIDAANPFVVVDAESLPSASMLQGSDEWLETIEDIRRQGAIMMGLASSVEQAALTRGTPKIMMVSSPSLSGNMETLGSPSADISVLSMSMGKIHPSVQLTGAVCLASACCVPGTVAHRYSIATKNILHELGLDDVSSASSSPSSVSPSSSRQQSPLPDDKLVAPKIMIAHRSGQIPVEVRLSGERDVERCIVSRTARKLFEGNVLFYT